MITYGVADTGIAAVGNALLNVPFAPMVAGWVTPLIVMDTVSPTAAKILPPATAPESVMELVPTATDCDGVKPVKNAVTIVAGVTVIVPMDSTCWLVTVTDAASL